MDKDFKPIMIKKAIEYIGANIQTYGHFDCYMIPESDGSAIYSLEKYTKEDFLALVYQYYTSKTLWNHDYGNDLKDQNCIKRFICKRINSKSFDVGDEYIKVNFK